MEEDNGDFYYNGRPRIHNLNHNVGFDLENPMLDLGNFINQSPSPSSPSASSEDTESDNDPGSPENQEEIPLPPDPDVVMANEAQPLIAYQVLNALVHGKNMLIECPPGRERALTILKQILHYFQWKKNDMRMENAENYKGVPAPTPKRIYVVTRNFNESKKFLQEIKTELLVGTNLLWNIKISVLDHRKNYCVNEEVMRNGADSASVDNACRKILRSFNNNTPSSSKRAREEEEVSCEFFINSRNSPNGAVPFIQSNNQALFGVEINSIEDFVEENRGTRRCPYYDSLHLAKKADLIFLPADIFLSPYFRQEYSIDLEQAIVFIDDGFDLENLCKEQASVDMSLHQLNQACATIRHINEDYQQRVQDGIGIGLIELVNFLPILSKFVTSNEHDPRPEKVLDVIRKLNIDALNIPAVTQEILDFGENAPANIDIDVGTIDKLRKLVTVLGLLLGNNADGKERFRVQIKARESLDNRDHEMFFQITCADPCLIMAPIEDSVISLIVGSNCIAPYPPFYNEFNGMFTEDRTLKIEHDSMMMSRYLIEYTTKGPSGAKFALGFDARDEPMVKREVLMAILELCKVIPQNVICFFHSWNYLRSVVKYMQNESIVPGRLIEEEIASEKRIFCETDATNDIETQELMQNFCKAVQEPGGAVLFALHRGKLCKNYDLEHESVRGIIHVSIPFGPWYHHQDIVAKRKFIGESTIENLDWYHCEAFRILNQSFNYCVRKREDSDWGVIVVLDSRMHGERHKFQDNVPHWARQRNFPKHRRDFSALITSVRTKVREWTARVGNQ